MNKLIFKSIFVMTFMFGLSSGYSQVHGDELGPLFVEYKSQDNTKTRELCMKFRLETIKGEPTGQQYARWYIKVFKTTGEKYLIYNGIVSKSDYTMLVNKLKPNKLYKPDEFYSIVGEHLGPKTNSTSMYLENIKYDNYTNTGHYIFEHLK